MKFDIKKRINKINRFLVIIEKWKYLLNSNINCLFNNKLIFFLKRINNCKKNIKYKLYDLVKLLNIY